MARVSALTREYRSLGLLLLLVAAGSATAIVSCGGGGGSSDGGLCSQCGVSPDGPCQDTVFVGPGPDATALCPDPAVGCTVRLTCRRKVDSAQQRCFPLTPEGGVNFQFKCDGSRPGGTAVPEPTLTPTPLTATSAPVVTATPGPNCGNGIVDADEECDGINLDGNTCDDLCTSAGGALGCSGTCTFDFTGCTDPSSCSP